MGYADHLPKIIIALVVLGGGAIAVSKMTGSASSSVLVVDVAVPPLSAKAKTGKRNFDQTCAQCHGVNAAGSENGPPLIHDIYNPGHHSDQAFQLAAMQGVRRHHWHFGDMPAQPQVSAREVASIISYVRELQQANGIIYREHRM